MYRLYRYIYSLQSTVYSHVISIGEVNGGLFDAVPGFVSSVQQPRTRCGLPLQWLLDGSGEGVYVSGAWVTAENINPRETWWNTNKIIHLPPNDWPWDPKDLLFLEGLNQNRFSTDMNHQIRCLLEALWITKVSPRRLQQVRLLEWNWDSHETNF